MKLPRGEEAVVDIWRIADYVLSREHPLGKHKARVFESVLGLLAVDAEILLQALKSAALTGEAVERSSDAYGARYQIDFELAVGSRTARVRSGWLVPEAPEPPRFLTAHVI